VVVNSTVGLSAIHHDKPVLACGNAIFDMEGLTWQGDMDNFWTSGSAWSPDSTLYRRFRDYVLYHTQLNGNFYKRLPIPGSSAGLNWGHAGKGLDVPLMVTEFAGQPAANIESDHEDTAVKYA